MRLPDTYLPYFFIEYELLAWSSSKYLLGVFEFLRVLTYLNLSSYVLKFQPIVDI